MEVPAEREKADVICAVCHRNIADSKWYEHVARKHSYLAWKEGEEPLVCKIGKSYYIEHKYLSTF